MPRRNAPPDLEEFRRNEFLRYPGGNALLSDVGDAGNAMQLGGDAATPRASVPYTRTTTGEPQVQVWNNQTEGGVLHWDGRPIVESGVEIDPAQTGQDNYDPAQPFFSLPHQAVDVTTGPTYQTTGSRFDELPGNTYGEPTVQTPTATAATATNLDNEPSLFAQTPVNPFDEWWRQTDVVSGEVAGGAQANLSGDAGSIFADYTPPAPSAEASAGVGPQESFGAGAEADLPESAFNPVPEPTGTPVEPDVLPQEYEWTTSPEDRRFLPGSEPATETASANRGGDISSFGTFGSPLTLGQFLNTSLQNMNFGGGYPAVGSGQLDINDQSGATTNWNSVRQQWERYNPTTQEFEAVGGRQPPSDYPAPGTEDWSSNAGPRPPAPEDDGTGTSIIHRDEPIDLNVDFTDTRLSDTSNTGTPSYGLPGQYGSAWNVPATARNMGGINSRTGQSFQSQESAALMNAVTGWGFSAPYRTSPDMPQTFSVGGMRLDDEGGFEQVGFGRVGSDRRLESATTRARAQRLTTAQGRAGRG